MATRKFLYTDANGDYVESAGAYEVADFINVSTGGPDAGKPIVLDSEGKIDPSMISFNGLSYKDPVRVTTDANIADLAAGAPDTVDGVSLQVGDRVLVKSQSTGAQNGIYVVDVVGTGADGEWSRALDFDEDAEVKAGAMTIVTEGTANEDTTWLLTTNDPITVGSTALSFAPLPLNTFTGGDGITINSSGEIAVDLLDSGSGLQFAGGGSDELAIEFASTFTIDSADALAPKASDYASTSNGEGASRIGVEDASGYYTGTDLESVLNELEGQLGGATSSTFDFTEANVLADDDSVYPALEKLDLKWGDLASTANGEGASLVGIEDTGSYFTGTTVEAALQELGLKVEENEDFVEYTVGTGGVTKGDLVYVSAADTVLPYSTLANAEYGIGLAATTEAAAGTVRVLADDEILTGVLTGATPGDKYFWDGSSITSTLPGTGGQYVWQVGIAKNATDLHTDVKFVKKNI